MNSPHLGAFELEIEGKAYTIAFPISALARIQGEFGGTGLVELLDGSKPDTLLILLEIGLAKYHPGMKADDLGDAIIPLVPLRNALIQALNFAMIGPEKPKAGKGTAEGEGENPPKPKATR